MPEPSPVEPSAGEPTPFFDRQVPDYEPPAPAPAPTAPAPAPAPIQPGQAPQPAVPPQPGQPAPAQPPAEPAPELTFSEKLAKARETANPAAADVDPGGDGGQQLNRVEEKLDEINAKPTGPGQQRDADGKLVGDPNLPWHEAGSSQEPPSWQAVIDRAKEEGKTEILKELDNKAEEVKQQQAAADKKTQDQVTALKTSGAAQNDEEVKAIANVALKYQQFDLFKAAELWDDLGKPMPGQEREVQRREERATTFGKVNSGHAAEPGSPAKPTYQQIHLRTLDDIAADAIKDLTRDAGV